MNTLRCQETANQKEADLRFRPTYQVNRTHTIRWNETNIVEKGNNDSKMKAWTYIGH